VLAQKAERVLRIGVALVGFEAEVARCIGNVVHHADAQHAAPANSELR